MSLKVFTPTNKTSVHYVSITPQRIVTYSRVERHTQAVKLFSVSNVSVTPKGELSLFPATDRKALNDWLRSDDMTPIEVPVIQTSVTPQSLANLQKKKYTGRMSLPAKKRLAMCINWMYTLTPAKRVFIEDIGKTVDFKLNMITLTLSDVQAHDDKFIKGKMLNRFLEILREKHSLKTYLWRAETQKNGNIHFHITTDIYIHFRNVRDVWNSIQKKYGYLDNYAKVRGHYDANSTDVHAIYKIKNLASYLCKYMSKDVKGRPIDGRQWFLSSNLSKCKAVTHVFADQLANEITEYADNQSSKYVVHEYATVIYCDIFHGDLSMYPMLYGIRDRVLHDYRKLLLEYEPRRSKKLGLIENKS